MNIWILTEEKPKVSVTRQLLSIFCNDFGGIIDRSDLISITPSIHNNVFEFQYIVTGIKLHDIDNIIIKIVSGSSSFMDFLFFLQENAPTEGSTLDNLIFATEETKTSDDESRNTGVYQRCSKFVFIKSYYNVPLYMLYNDEASVREEKKPSDTSIFGTNLLLTIGVKIIGKLIDSWFYPFNTIQEIIEFKTRMRRPPGNNIPIEIHMISRSLITISGRLDKPQNIGKIAHDPNIGALSIIAYSLRYLGWQGEIVITRHGVTQNYIDNTNGKNKFLYIAGIVNISLAGLNLPVRAEMPDNYWHYEMKSEKMASILFHVLCENRGFIEVYQNHAGCERGYFKTRDCELITLPKKTPAGENLLIPDVIVRDESNKVIILIEGKKLDTISAGLAELKGYDDIERLYIQPYFPGYTVYRRLTIFGGHATTLPHPKVLFYLSEDGRIINH